MTERQIKMAAGLDHAVAASAQVPLCAAPNTQPSPQELRERGESTAPGS